MLQTHSHAVKHIITGEELLPTHIHMLLQKALVLKRERSSYLVNTALSGHHLALLFEKPSLRTRFSFAVAMRELGGEVIESIEGTRKSETPEDQARVLSGYCQAIMMRTHEESVLEKMSQVASVPIINGLSNFHHPCQILADLFTLLEVFKRLEGLTVCYIGDGNNILHSLLLLAPEVGVNVHYCCPPSRQPEPAIVVRSQSKLHSKTGKIQSFSEPKLALQHAHAVYTDVWASMGFENQAQDDLFLGFQVNEESMMHAKPNAVFMHCLPMIRGKEVSSTLPDQPCSVIFQQSENRLHVQKALLLFLLKGNPYD